jgi:hypothetical protein
LGLLKTEWYQSGKVKKHGTPADGFYSLCSNFVMEMAEALKTSKMPSDLDEELSATSAVARTPTKSKLNTNMSVLNLIKMKCLPGVRP